MQSEPTLAIKLWNVMEGQAVGTPAIIAVTLISFAALVVLWRRFA
jgi:hypothetical protein